MKSCEIPVSFLCAGDTLYGVLHQPSTPSRLGVLISAGGLQYRVGSHRQFVLLARAWAESGIPVMRFDYRGVGDSEGALTEFPGKGPDIAAAIDLFTTSLPGLNEIVIWGLCEGASAALFYAPKDSRVTGVILVNPYIFSEDTMARADLKHYYLPRLRSPDLYAKIYRREFNYVRSIRVLFNYLLTALGISKSHQGVYNDEAPGENSSSVDSLAEVLKSFKGQVMLILSGDDLLSVAFKNTVAASQQWQELLSASRVTRHDLPEANHIFSCRLWRDQIALWVSQWLDSRFNIL
jgi:uncharacterized protein